jgi:endonuclease/exonuclease/phosphatase family metal-dependent hydrolase
MAGAASYGPVLVLTWNLFHGRAVPEQRRELLPEFAAALAGWDWDVALLQEVPPWWPPALAAATGATWRSALTSRNLGLPVRRAVARRRPDLLKSNGGGANAILVRGAITAHHLRTLRRRPERRVVHAVRLGDGTWVGNVHAQVRPHALTRADLALAGATLLAWAGPLGPAVLGGDLNVPDPAHGLPPELVVAPGPRGVDHVAARGLAGSARKLERAGGLSDHDPVLASLRTSP